MKRYTFLLVTVLVAAMSFVFFSCSSDGGGGITSGALTINNPPSADVTVTVIDYSQQLRNQQTLYNLTITGSLTAAIAGAASQDPSSPVSLIKTQDAKKFSQSGTFLVQVSTMQPVAIRYFDQVEFEKGGAIIDWNANYLDGISYNYVGGGSQTGNSSSSGGSGDNGNSSSSGSSGTGILDNGLINGSDEAWLDCFLGECDGFIFLADGSFKYVYRENLNSDWEVDYGGEWSINGTNLIISNGGSEISFSYTIESADKIVLILDDYYIYEYHRNSVNFDNNSGNSSSSSEEKTCSLDSDPDLIWDRDICKTGVATGGGWYYYADSDESGTSTVEWGRSTTIYYTGEIDSSMWSGSFKVSLKGSTANAAWAGMGFSWLESGEKWTSAFQDRAGFCLEYAYIGESTSATCTFRINSDRADYKEFEASLPAATSKTKKYYVVNSSTFTNGTTDNLSTATSNSSGLQVHCTSNTSATVYLHFYSLYWGTCN